MKKQRSIIWLDLGEFGDLVSPRGPHEQWQDHGLGLLRTIAHRSGIGTDIASIRLMRDWADLAQVARDYDVMLMNVRSYTYPIAARAASIFKRARPDGTVLVGGMHASVALNEMLAVPAFDRICQGAAEESVAELLRHPADHPRVVTGSGAKTMGEWPMIDRTLWPKPANPELESYRCWPLEPACGWGPPPVATVLTSRVCPWQCAFCNESAYIPNAQRKPVDAVIDELNFLDDRYHVGSVVIHDSMFFQNPHWLEEWLEKYPVNANKTWPYWAAARADTVLRWPDLFEALVKETNWSTISIGFESGSDRVLKILNKECTSSDNYRVIGLVNRIGDELERAGRRAPVFWANIMLGVPGETREDAFATMRMLRHMKRVQPSIAFYAPYPGSALGDQLIAEGKSLMTTENYHRYPSDEKVKDVDYSFYRDLLRGRYDGELERLPASAAVQPTQQPSAAPRSPHRIYLFSMNNGKKKLAYGATPQDAYAALRLRLDGNELAAVIPGEFLRITQRELGEYIDLLG